MNILITICARGGSKSVKNKCIREICGKPLIHYTIKVAKEWGKGTIICSTDFEAIARIAQEEGIEVPFLRSPELADDHTGKVAVIRDALIRSEKEYKKRFDLIVDLDVTSPIRSTHDLDQCLKIFSENDVDVVFSAVPARRNPYFNMVEEQENGYVQLAKPPKSAIMRRQDTPNVYDMNASIYFYKRAFLLDEQNTSPLSSKKIMVHVMDELAAVDIDSELDFNYIQYLLESGVVKI